MKIDAACTYNVVTVDRGEALRTAARLMRERHIGALVVTGSSDGRTPVIGIVTDRDLVISGLASDLDPGSLTVGDVASTDLVAVPATASVGEAVATMRQSRLRRLLVVDDEQRLVGIATIDDLLEALAFEIADLAEAMRSGPAREGAAYTQPAPRPTDVLIVPPDALAPRWRRPPSHAEP